MSASRPVTPALRGDAAERSVGYSDGVKINGILMLLSVLLVGCGTRPQTVEVTVRNDAEEPVVLWLTKSGPPVEEAWLSPGQVAAFYAPGDADHDLSQLPAVPLQPGEQVAFPPRKGRFPEGVFPVMKVYFGKSDLEALAGTATRGPNVDTVPLGAGQNFVVVRQVRPVNAQRVSEGIYLRRRNDGGGR